MHQHVSERARVPNLQATACSNSASGWTPRDVKQWLPGLFLQGSRPWRYILSGPGSLTRLLFSLQTGDGCADFSRVGPLKSRRGCLQKFYYTVLHYTVLYYTILYYTILYYTILYYTILYYTIPPAWGSAFRVQGLRIMGSLACFGAVGGSVSCEGPLGCTALGLDFEIGASQQKTT